jgi:hypothetical protein
MKIASLLLYFTVGFSVVSCNESKTSTAEPTPNADTTQTVAIVDSTQITAESPYAADWENFKSALLAKDVQKVAAFFQSDNLDAEQVIQAFHEDFVLPVLQKTTFADLRKEEMDGQHYLLFYAEITGTDEEGAEVGSSYSFYFQETEKGLQLVYYIAAG